VDGDTPTLQPTSTTNIGDPLNIPPATSVSFTTTYDVREKALWLTVVPTFDHSAYKYYSDRFEVWSRATEGLSVSQNSVTGKKKFKKRTLTYNNVVLSHPSGEHEFRIVPINTYGQAAPLGKIPTVVYTVLTEAQAQTIPTAPANLTATSTGLGVSLNWTIDASDEKEYATTFIIKEGNPTPTTTIATDVKGTSYTIPAVTKRSNRFWVYAVTAAGKQSNASVYADYNKVAPPAPTDIEIQQTGEGITLLFEKSTSNLVTRSLTHWRLAGGTWRSAKADNMINHNEVDILPNETYEMRVANIDHLSASLNDYVWSPTYSINTTHMDTVENEKIRLQNSISFNLVRCGAFVKDPSLYWTMGSTEVVQYPSAPQYDYVAGDNNVGRIKATYEYGSFIKSREKAYYTMSADIQNLSATSFQFRLRCYNSSNTLISTLLSPSVLAASMSFSEFMRASYSFETPSGTVNMKPAIVVAGTGSILADGIMLQAGMRATGFMPHISEVLSQQDLESMAKEDEVTPPTPSTTTFLATGNFRSIYLNWDAPASPADGVAWYNIYRSTSPESTSAIKVGSSQVNFYTDSSGVTGKLYYYWITAVSNTGNESAKTTYITGSMIGATSSDIQNAAIINAHIADAAIDDAKIGNLSASKILAGTITAESIGLGASGRVKLLAGSAPGLTITRPNNNLALKLGKFDGSYDDNYGLWLYDNSGQLVVSVDGLGLDVVGTKNIANNSVTNSSAVNSTVDYNLSTNYEPVLETYLTTSGGNVFILATAMVNPGNIGRILYWRILRGDYIIQDGTYYAGSGGIVGGLCSVSAVDVAVTGTHRYSLELTISSSAGAYVGLRTLFVQEVKK
jgi:hypothetical protein